ncbi:MAG: hypothetical protein AAB767_04690 [Patescibacteria group bacterium]
MATKKIMIIIGTIVLVGAIFWGMYKGPLWNTDSEGNIPLPFISDISRRATMDSPGIQYGYVAASSTAERKTDIPPPSLDRQVIIPASFLPRTVTEAKKEIETLVTSLKENPANATLWADLGMARKGIEDYEGAKEAYAYALKLIPRNAVFADNLGVIYGDYLKDYQKAEEYYRLAVTLDPKTSYRYLRLFEFYRYLLRNSAKARAILEEGLRAIPGETSFTSLLETL